MTLNLTAQNGVVTAATVGSPGRGYKDACRVRPLQNGASGDALVTLGVTPNIAILLDGIGAQLRKLKIDTAWTGGRVNHTASDAIQVRGDQWLIDSVHIVGAPQMGIQGRGAKNGVVQNTVVEGTASDGIDFSYCSSNNLVNGNKILNPGDDGLSINSYSQDPCATTQITFTNNQIVNSAAHGLAIAGGSSITATNLSVNGARDACIQIYSASTAYDGLTPATNINIKDVQANRCGAAGIQIYAETAEHNVDHVTIDGFVGANLLGHGIWTYFRKNPGTFVSNVNIMNSSFTASPAISGSNHGAQIAGMKDITLIGNTFSGFTGYCLVASGDKSNAGQFRFEKSNCVSNNMGNASPSALRVPSTTGFATLSVQGNSVRNGPNPLKWFAHFGTESAPITFSGNHGDVVSRVGGTNIR